SHGHSTTQSPLRTRKRHHGHLCPTAGDPFTTLLLCCSPNGRHVVSIPLTNCLTSSAAGEPCDEVLSEVGCEVSIAGRDEPENSQRGRSAPFSLKRSGPPSLQMAPSTNFLCQQCRLYWLSSWKASPQLGQSRT